LLFYNCANYCQRVNAPPDLLEFENIDEAGQLEHILDVVVHIAQNDAAACCFGTLEDAEQDAQSAGGNIIFLVHVWQI